MFVKLDKEISYEFFEKPTIPTIEITPEALYESKAYVDLCDNEIGWLAHITRKGNTYIIDKCYLPKQEVTGSSCQFTEEGLSEIMVTIISERGPEYYDEIRCWCHSHVNMPVIPSSQDLKQVRKWCDSDYQIMIIFNKKGVAHAEFYNFRDKIIFNNLPIELHNPNKTNDYQNFGKLISECVTGRAHNFQNTVFDYQDMFDERLDKSPVRKVIRVVKENKKSKEKSKFVDIESVVRKCKSARAEVLRGGYEHNHLSLFNDIIQGYITGEETDILLRYCYNSEVLRLFEAILKNVTLKKKISRINPYLFDSAEFAAKNSTILPDFDKFDIESINSSLEFLPLFVSMRPEEILELAEIVKK